GHSTREEMNMIHGGRLERVLRPGIVGAVLLLASFGSVSAQDTAVSKVALPRIEANRNLSPAGQLRDGVLALRLEIREGDWFPEADTGPAIAVQAFAEEGQPLQIPGPLIRVPDGTEVRATVHNALDKLTAHVYGLHGRPGDGKKPLEIPPGEIREVRFKLA